MNYKALLILVLAGIGWLVAYTPSVWKLIVYSIPALAFYMLILCIFKLMRGVFGDEDQS